MTLITVSKLLKITYLDVIITLLFGFEHHCKNNSLENPLSMSGELANTTFGLETLLNS